MTLDPCQLAEFDRLLNALCEETLDEAGQRRLAEMLAGNPDAQRRYIAAMDMHANLVWSGAVGPATALRTTPDGLIDRNANQTPNLLGYVTSWVQQLPGTQSFLWMLVGFLVTIVGLPIVMAIWSVLGHSEPSVAQLVTTVNCRWADANATIPAGSQLRAGQKIDLAAGEARIAFARGAVLALHGPGRIELLSDNAARLLLGAVTATVETKESRGFMLRLPAARVVDLGTEFRAEVAADGNSSVDVIRGVVEIDDSAGRRRDRLVKGETARIVAGPSPAFVKIEATPQPFTLYSTGARLAGWSFDPHWQITQVSHVPFFKPIQARVGSPHMPSSAYVKDSFELGQWLLAPGTYPASCRITFRTEFDLTGFDPASAKIDGRCGADNYLVEIRLNGHKVPLGDELALRPDLVSQTCPVRIDKGFVAGHNIVEIVVENADPPGHGSTPMALLVQWKGVARRIARSSFFE